MKNLPISSRILEIKRNRRIRRIRLSIIFSIIFILFIFGLSYSSSHRKLTLDGIIVSGNSIIDDKEVKSKVESDLVGNYLHLFSRANIFIYPKKQIYNDLIKSFPRIESLLVYRENLNTLHIEITERLGSYLYCGVEIPEISSEIGENCYFLNNNGYIFDKAPYFSGDIYFKYYLPISFDKADPSGSQMMDSNRFHELVRFIDRINSISFNPIYLQEEIDNYYSLYLKGESNNPKILFKKDADLSIIFENLSVAMEKQEFSDEIKSNYSKLQYIDLRFKNRVVYKIE